MMKTRVALLVLLVSVSGFSDCELSQTPPDQTIINPLHKMMANPRIEPRDFQAINAGHKLLLGVFDSGVDYNHPLLKRNLHFDLDGRGRAVGLGKDYYEENATDSTRLYTAFASYRVVDTRRYMYADLPSGYRDMVLKKMQLNDCDDPETVYNSKIIEIFGEEICQADALLSIDPRLSKYVDIFRDYSTEEVHGTHVAGLMTYDRSDFGLVPYRLLPYHRTEGDMAAENDMTIDRFTENFADAVADASSRGIRVVNVSIGSEFKKPDTTDPDKLAGFRQLLRVNYERMSQIVKNHPEILFIAAASNESSWFDNVTLFQMPCGVEASNVLCVGALNYDATFASFTNVPLAKVPFVFASGVDILSTFPSDRCEEGTGEDSIAITGSVELCKAGEDRIFRKDYQLMEQNREAVLKIFDRCSSEKNLYRQFSGTSMASPMVTHLAAEILSENPGLSPAAIITSIKSRAVMTSIDLQDGGYIPVYKLKLVKPSWYKTYFATDAERRVGDDSVFISAIIMDSTDAAIARESIEAGGWM